MYAGHTVYEGGLWPQKFTVDLQYGNYRTHLHMLTGMGRSRVDLSRGWDDLFANRPGVVFSHQTTPSTRQWDGSDSGLIIGDITAAGERMTFRAGMVTIGNMARGEVTADMLIPDDQPAGIQSPVTISERGQLKSVKARVSIMHTYIGDLQIELITPSGKRAMLHDRAGAGTDDLEQIWDSALLPTLAAFLGESTRGTWMLAIRDLDRRDTGRLNWWGLEIGYSSPDRVVDERAQSDVAIPDAGLQGVQSGTAIDATGAATDIKVSVDISHTYQGDLLAELVAPSGRSATLHNRTEAQRMTRV